MMFFPFKRHDEGNILDIGRSEQYHTVEELVRRSQPSSTYYTLLVISAVIISAGLLIDNAAIVIGGMLVTPVLTPILLFSLGITIFEFRAVRKAGLLMIASLLVIAFIAWLLTEVFGAEKTPEFLVGDVSRVFYLYFLVAIASGIAATFAWARKEMTDVLPGIAMAVSLVPPVCLIGITISTSGIRLAEIYFYIFGYNLFGLVIGSFVVYTLLKFYKAREEVEREVEG